MKRKGKGIFCVYASGNGALHGVWHDDNEKKTCNITPVEKADFIAYQKQKKNSHLKNHKIVYLCGNWCAVAPVKRTGPDTLEISPEPSTEQPWTSRGVYRYRLDLPERFQGNELPADIDALVLSHWLTVWYVGSDGREFETKHISTRVTLAHFIRYEKEITEQE